MRTSVPITWLHEAITKTFLDLGTIGAEEMNVRKVASNEHTVHINTKREL